ncbi:MAG: precorrin-3B C(17)-methyltransferase [Alphaproteobacteria bacterium]|nr:precorrin-3B C(17)-methyltransferase [Alphaproteobacteria bacterium]
MSAAPAIFILGPSALPLALKIKAELGGHIHGPMGLAGTDRQFERATAEMALTFRKGHALIGLCASGILIRAVAPVLGDKHAEPPVIAVAEDGSSVVPLLGGHHGANDMARKIAALTGGQAALTTASDVALGEALDAPGGAVLANPEHHKAAAAAMLRGEAVTRETTIHRTTGGERHLVYHPLRLAVGLGCERGADPEELRQLLDETLARHNIAAEAIHSFGSIDLKEDEPAITQFGDVIFFPASRLKAEEKRLLTPSEAVAREVGTAGVSEAAALALAGPEARLIVPKVKSTRATLAIAEAPAGWSFANHGGKHRGVLSVVGIGPGGHDMLTPAAEHVLWQAQDWVGYSLYLDLIDSLRQRDQTRHDFPLGGEEDRVRRAIDLANEGRRVALVCSGDAGIYAMASLAFELIDEEPSRIAVEVIPGISAFQMASARVGALIGHDFCCISLSDLLTPWQAIEARVEAAAAGDFVTAFYNPRSRKRRDQLERAMAILARHRPPTTPVVIASNLGRPDEITRIVPLAEFNPEEVDMLTLVMVGASQSKAFRRGDGVTHAYTPRGYASKREGP